MGYKVNTKENPMKEITQTYTTMQGVTKDFEAMTKEDFHCLLKAKERRIEKLRVHNKGLAHRLSFYRNL